MTEPLQVGQFAIVDGEPVDRGPNAGIFHGKGPADDRAELFLLAEGTTPAGDAFAGHVVSALGHAFASLDMSLTGSLRRLFIEAERNLHDWNRKSIAQHRVALGLTAFGRRGDQAIIAQAGPALALHLHHGVVTRYVSSGATTTPIGSSPVVPELTRVPFDAGDRLLMISSPALLEVDAELLHGILQLPEDQVLPDLYRRVQDMHRVTVILVTGPQPRRQRQGDLASDAEFVIDATATRHERSDAALFQPSLFVEDESSEMVQSARAQLLDITPRKTIEGIVPAFVTEAPAPLLRVSGEASAAISRMAAQGEAMAARSRAATLTLDVAPPAFSAQRPPWRSNEEHVAHEPSESRPSPGGKTTRGQSFSRGLVNQGPPATPPELLAEDLPLAAEMAAGRRARNTTFAPVAEQLAAENGAAISGGTPLIRPRNNMGSRWKGNHSFGRRTNVASQLPPTWLVIMAALAVLIVIAGIATVPRLLSNDDSQRADTLLLEAQQRISASANQADAAQKRALLTEAQAMLLEARDLDSRNVQAAELITQVAGAITRMDNIVEPQSVETLASLEQFGARPVAVSRLVIGESAFLLDVNSSQVIAVPLNGAEPRAIFAENKDEKRAKPVAIAQLDEALSGGPALLIADAANRLWGYGANGSLRAVPFAAPANLVISDIAVSGRDLFVLDAGQSTIYRFSQTVEGFPIAPAKAVQNPDLANGRRLAVDSEFITTDGNGTLHRFANGGALAVTLSQSGIDKKLVAPETAQRLSETELALLDTSNDRIVVLRRDGAFLRQYRHPEFAGASAFVIRDGEAWVFSGSRLKRVVL